MEHNTLSVVAWSLVFGCLFRAVPRLSVHIASSFLRCRFLFIPTPTVFFYCCDIQHFFFFFFCRPSLSHSVFPSHRLWWILGASPVVHSPLVLSSRTQTLHPTSPIHFYDRLRFDHLNPLILILYLIIYSQPPSTQYYIFYPLFSFLLHSIVKTQMFVLLLALLADLI